MQYVWLIESTTEQKLRIKDWLKFYSVLDSRSLRLSPHISRVTISENILFQEMAALEEAVYAQKELINFLEEQVKINKTFQRESPPNDREK